jgi:DNA-directed RNA polymerase subunit RPC12/RpoP
MLPTHDVDCPECGKFVYTALSLEDVLTAESATTPKILSDAQGDYLRCPHCGARIAMKRVRTKGGIAFRISGRQAQRPKG